MNNKYPFELTPLPYAYNALEPFIDEKTMQIHHDIYFKGYIDNLNATIKPYPFLYDWSIEKLLRNINVLPMQIRTPIAHFAGGAYNHGLFFCGLSPHSGITRPSGNIAVAIDNSFGSYENYIDVFTKTALSIFGSGYTWLIADNFGKLKIISMPNQDTPNLSFCKPLIAFDAWEHAYFLKHYNKRADYIADWFNVVNWENVNSILKDC